MTGRLPGRIALITGIGGGMGRAAALRFAAEGARVVGCDLKAESLTETVRLVREQGGQIEGFAPVDLSDAEAAGAWVDAAAAVFGGVDILFNNASHPVFGAIDEMSVQTWDHGVANELSLIFYTTRVAWKHLKKSDAGVIVNTGSIAGTRGVEFMPQNVHGAAKAGVINLTQQLAVEGAPHRIRAVAVSPGFIVTPATEWLVENGDEAFRKNIARIPLGRVGRPEDVVNAALFLASEEASWITGINLVIDGGGTVLG